MKLSLLKLFETSVQQSNSACKKFLKHVCNNQTWLAKSFWNMCAAVITCRQLPLTIKLSLQKLFETCVQRSNSTCKQVFETCVQQPNSACKKILKYVCNNQNQHAKSFWNMCAAVKLSLQKLSETSVQQLNPAWKHFLKHMCATIKISLQKVFETWLQQSNSACKKFLKHVCNNQTQLKHVCNNQTQLAKSFWNIFATIKLSLQKQFEPCVQQSNWAC